MSKRSVFTTITPLPAGITRESVMSTLRNHIEMIDLNPLVIKRELCKPPSFAGPEEYHVKWYSITDTVPYVIGKSKVSYHGCFHDLVDGLQTHVYAPAGLDIRGKWRLGGSLPGEPIQPVEMGLGIPKTGLYLREDVDMKCNIVMTSFVRKTLKKAHSTLVARLLEKATLLEVEATNDRLSVYSGSLAGSSLPGSPFLRPASPDPTGVRRWSGGWDGADKGAVYADPAAAYGFHAAARPQYVFGADGIPVAIPQAQPMKYVAELPSEVPASDGGREGRKRAPQGPQVYAELAG